MNKVKTIKVISLIMFFLFLSGALSFTSYKLSKRNAEQFVGTTLQHYPLSHAIITYSPFGRGNFVWRLTFSNPDPHVFDDEFDIYTTFLGKLAITNPRDLGVRLTELENSESQSNSIKVRKEFELKQIKEKQIIHEKGVSLFESSSFSKSFLEHFKITDIEFQEHNKSKVFFNGPEWRATLLPKHIYQFPVKVMAVFPVKDKIKIESSITPEEIENALEKLLSHPYVKEHIARTVVTGIRFDITGDRLHWDTPEIQELLVKLKGTEDDEKQLRNWASIFIDGKYQSYMPLYFNPITGELIYREGETICSPPILIPGEHIDTKQTMHYKSHNKRINADGKNACGADAV
jgi:hypothetical protein